MNCYSSENKEFVVDKPARLISRLLFGFVSDPVYSVFVKLNKNENKY